MNIAAEIRLNDIVRKIEACDFGENEIRSLYQILRQKSDKNGITRELADFLAHPEEKDRGILFDKVKNVIDGWIEHEQGLGPAPSPSPISYIDIIDDINKELSKNGAIKICRSSYERTSLIVLILLQMHEFRKKGLEEISLHVFVFEDGSIELCGYTKNCGTSHKVIFPIIRMPNVFGIGVFMLDPGLQENTILQAKFESGKLEFWQESRAIRVSFT